MKQFGEALNRSSDETSPIEHAAREFHGYYGSQYALPADDAERQRYLLFSLLDQRA
jgi:hypothetical protein